MAESFQRFGHGGWREAVEGGTLVVEMHLELRDEHLLLDLQVDEAWDRGRRCAALGGARSVSRSSPKILRAICARTPESM